MSAVEKMLRIGTCVQGKALRQVTNIDTYRSLAWVVYVKELIEPNSRVPTTKEFDEEVL